jgi:protein MBA1
MFIHKKDVTIPNSLSPTRLRSYPGLRAIYDQFMFNLQNTAKNATRWAPNFYIAIHKLTHSSLLQLAQSNAVPGIDLSGASLFQKFITQWPWRILTAASTSPNGWMASLRRDALSTYLEVNTALAK